MDLIEDIGPILGIVAFLGFAILALLIVLQAREVRRLREWAGRAPERAREADEADRAAAEARGEEIEEEEGEPGRIAAFRERFAGAVGSRYAALDRRSPVDLRWFMAALLAGLIAVGVVTSGFGLVGDDEPAAREEGRGAGRDGGREGGGRERDQQPTVTVLNATQIDDPVAPVPAVPGIADVVAAQIVEPAGFTIEERTNAPSGEPNSLIMFAPESEEAAQELASAVEPDLGPTEVVPITDEISAVARGADLVLIVGQDDDEVGQTTAPVQ
jgi:LytR cell envelope-related transcriptional attenuator